MLNNYAHLLKARGDVANAEPMFRRSLEIKRRVLPGDHPYIGIGECNLAIVLGARGEHAEAEQLARQAEQLARQAEAIFLASYGEDHWRTAIARSVLGASLAGQGRFDDAEALLVDSYRVIEQQRGNAFGYAGEALDRLVALYEAFSVEASGERYGMIKIHTFAAPDVEEFIRTFETMLEHRALGRHGLIIDVRGNGGGNIPAGERLLQMQTPRDIEPARFQFLSSALNLELCRRVSGFEPWIESIEASVATGDTYSRGLPLTPPEDCNDLGQKYHGPTVLLTDANCYSTTDMFAAGFKDHGIGKILGVYGNTGAGGANTARRSRIWAWCRIIVTG